jgi:nuclear protein localization family protein 4
MIYLILDRESSSSVIKFDENNNSPSKLTDLKEDDVDIQLDKIDGRIPRQIDPQLYKKKFYLKNSFFRFRCHHNKHGKCLNCIPVEPYDEEFLKNRNPPIKHMSFRAYIRKLQSTSPSEK